VTLTGSFTDPGSDDTHTVTVNWGDGTSTLTLVKGSRVFSATHQYLDDAPSGTASDSYAVSVTVSDDDAGSASASSSVTVNNLAPQIVSVTGPAGAIAVGGSATITVNYTDAGTLDTHTAIVTWDDSTTSPATCAAGACTASHTFSAAGVYSVTVVLSDDDTGTAAGAFNSVVVVDVDGGFVTGGGFINTPNGKANFNVNAKYQKGDTIPTGNTSFGGVDFNSTSYEWLVVSGSRAQYKGAGKVNGVSGYSFLVTVADEAVDRYRIKIWQTSNGNVVYDSNPGAPDDIDSANPQPLGGGNITIHSK